MGQAREIMDRITEAVRTGDAQAIAACYAEDAVAETPDAGRLSGRDAIVEYMLTFATAFTDMDFEMIASAEIGDTAVDEGFLLGKHTGVLPLPDGGEVAPTGRSMRVRECDVIDVAGGVAVSHRFYFDQLDFLGQLGLVQPNTIVLPEQVSTGARS
jgi:uncharacterized protein (TIGR02246 family)